MCEAVISRERTVFFSHKNTNKIGNLRNSSLGCSAEGVTAEKQPPVSEGRRLLTHPQTAVIVPLD